MVKANSIVSLLALGSSALAFQRQPNRQIVEEFISCTTELGPKTTHHVPTNWHYKTRTLTYTERVTITPHSVVTPTKTKTKTVTNIVETAITEPPYTDVATTVITSTSYVTTTNVVSLTGTTTIDSTTTTTPTTTIPAPTDFTPITHDQDYVAKVKARSAKNLLERGQEGIQCKKGPHGGHSFYPPMYPQSVTCNKLIEPIVIKRVTYTAKACTQTAPPKTKTVTATVEKTHTDTIWPCNVTSTVTSSTLTVVTSSVDSTVTATVTSTNVVSASAPEQTLLAACGSDNAITTANGGAGLGVTAVGSINFSAADATDSYQCCVACFNTAACRGSYYYPGECFLIVDTDGTCSPNQYSPNTGYFTQQGIPGTATVGNGPCGLLANLGPE
ncbi:hypothetical protein GGI43DRAFT_379967 [Trichoderma evansii]